MTFIPSVRSSIKRSTAAAVLGLAGLVGTALPATHPTAQDYSSPGAVQMSVAAPAADPQAVVLLPNAPGLSGAWWKNEVMLHNPSVSETATGEIVLTAYGVNGSPADLRVPYSIPPRATERRNVLGELGATGSYAAVVTPSNGVSPVVTYRVWNEQERDGKPETGTTQLTLQDRAVTDSDYAYPGDVARIPLISFLPTGAMGSTATNRLNVGLRGEVTSDDQTPHIIAVVRDIDGTNLCTKEYDLPLIHI